MRPTTIALLAAAVTMLAACDRPAPSGEASGGTTPRSVPGSPSGTPQALPNSSGDRMGAPPTATERQSSAQPVQGQVDPKQAAQHRDFRHPQEQAAPKPN